jgi:molybdopterin-binding protein
MKLSSRNVLKGTITRVAHGQVNSEITLELPGGQEIVSMITKSSAERLQLAVGKEVFAIIKASNVILGTED